MSYYWALAPAGLPGTLAPELDPDPELEPELPLELEPMPGHECFPGGAPEGGVVPVFAPAGGIVGVVGVAVEVLDVNVAVPLLAELEAAPALEMPASAPPVASAPATIVAPSNLMYSCDRTSVCGVGWLCRSIVRHGAKATQRPV